MPVSGSYILSLSLCSDERGEAEWARSHGRTCLAFKCPFCSLTIVTVSIHRRGSPQQSYLVLPSSAETDLINSVSVPHVSERAWKGCAFGIPAFRNLDRSRVRGRARATLLIPFRDKVVLYVCVFQ